VDILLKSMPKVFKQFPHQLLIIAGKTNADYILDDNILQKYERNTLMLNRYIPNEELYTLISNAKFIICPYLDATQSGVLMTSFALGVPVIASDVGSFPEFVIDGFNGFLVAPGNVEDLSEKIIMALKDNHYEVLAGNLSVCAI
jgi:glycosyltransferase involved in cell wall biosynthesis